MVTSAVTSHNSHLRLAIGNCHSEQIGDLAHHVGTTYRAVKALDGTGISTLDECVGHSPAAGKATAATVGTWQQFTHLRNTGVFIDSEFLGGCKQHQGCYQAYGSKYNHRNQDEIHKCFIIYLF